MTPHKPRIEKWARQAIDDAHQEDHQIFREPVHERSIVFHIGHRLDNAYSQVRARTVSRRRVRPMGG
jgi:DNA-directed RNA polymerase sigma subunit (sigma70/sigma32)